MLFSDLVNELQAELGPVKSNDLCLELELLPLDVNEQYYQ
jgi:hypothetical protein